MNVKELKEILNGLPDDATVIVSEKYGRGGNAQGYTIGKLKGSTVVGRNSETEKLIRHFEEHKFKCDLGIDELTVGTAVREELTSDDGRELVVWKSKDGTPFQYFRKGDEWTKEEMIKIFKLNSDEDTKHIASLNKELNKKLKKIDAIEISCGF